MKKIILIGNHDIVLYNFRRELIEQLLINKYKVFIVLPYGKRVDQLIELGCHFIDMPIDRRGTNIKADIKLIRSYFNIINKIKPDIVLTFTIKPNIYGGIVCGVLNTPFITNITGLGSAIENGGILKSITMFLYKRTLKKAYCVFFQNKRNMNFFINEKIKIYRYKLLPGSGVNIDKFYLLDYPSDDCIEFIFIGRVMKEKGINEYLEAAQYIKNIYNHTMFHIIGFCEEKYEDRLRELEDKGIIKYHGQQDDVIPFIMRCHCTILPSYAEGMSNVLLESASCGRPVMTTNRSGCRETVEDNVTGYLFKVKNSSEIIKKIEQFIKLPNNKKALMGLNGRRKIEKEFNRKIVTDEYMKEIERCTCKR